MVSTSPAAKLVENDLVISQTAGKGVIARSTVKDIIAIAAVEDVGTILAKKSVVACKTEDHVVASVAKDNVISRDAIKQVSVVPVASGDDGEGLIGNTPAGSPDCVARTVTS